VPTFRVEELLSMIEGEREERESRFAGLLLEHGLEATRVAEVSERLSALVARAAAKSPPPSREVLALGLLSLIALETP
jgi:hypothetical protein